MGTVESCRHPQWSRLTVEPGAIWRVGDPSRLYGLNDYVLNDIGLSRSEIGQGPAESFWRV